jgi:hypothetical protein
MIQHGRIISLRDDEFIVPAPALDWLKNQNFTPTILAWFNQDDVIQTPKTHRPSSASSRNSKSL